MLPKVIDPATITKDEIRELIAMLESEISVGPEVDIGVSHRFSKGVYAREIFIPKGTFLVGKIHRYENLNILSKGELTVLSIEGCARLKAPFTVVSPPGVKRVAYAHEDSVWTTIHGTDETDLAKIEEEFIVKSYAELDEKEN